MSEIYFKNFEGCDAITFDLAGLTLVVSTHFTVEHSGQIFHALGYDLKRRRYIWPIEEWIARWEYKLHLTETEIKRLKQLNKLGQTEGEDPKGVKVLLQQKGFMIPDD